MVMGATRFFRVLLSLRLPQHQKELVVASTSRTFDVGIVGAGPSGATAAIKLAAQGHDVALIDAATFPRKALCVGWLSAQAKPLLDDIGVSVKKFAGRALESVTFYNADLSKSAQPSFAEPPGILLDRTRFDQALVTAAAKAGATFLDGCRVTDVVLEEDSVSLVTADTDPIRSRLLIVASGRGTPLLARLKLGAESTPSVSWIAQVDAEVRGHKGAAALAVVSSASLPVAPAKLNTAAEPELDPTSSRPTAPTMATSPLMATDCPKRSCSAASFAVSFASSTQFVPL